MKLGAGTSGRQVDMDNVDIGSTTSLAGGRNISRCTSTAQITMTSDPTIDACDFSNVVDPLLPKIHTNIAEDVNVLRRLLDLGRDFTGGGGDVDGDLARIFTRLMGAGNPSFDRTLIWEGESPFSTQRMRIIAGDQLIVVTINAKWDNVNNRWDPEDTGADATALEITSAFGLKLKTKFAGPANWTSWDTTTTIRGGLITSAQGDIDIVRTMDYLVRPNLGLTTGAPPLYQSLEFSSSVINRVFEYAIDRQVTADDVTLMNLGILSNQSAGVALFIDLAAHGQVGNDALHYAYRSVAQWSTNGVTADHSVRRTDLSSIGHESGTTDADYGPQVNVIDIVSSFSGGFNLRVAADRLNNGTPMTTRWIGTIKVVQAFDTTA
jgi:hypothetical protein